MYNVHVSKHKVTAEIF